MKAIITLFVLSLNISLYAHQSEYIGAFPKAGKGMERFVLNLPEQEDESNFKVELIIGKSIKADKENKYFFNGTIKEEIIKGWGLTYYKLDSLGAMVGTMMAVIPNASKVERFISIGGEPFLIPYNTKVPVVVYVPEGVIVKYRIWSADKNIEIMKKD